MRIVSFNVNGIRAAEKRGVVSFLREAGDIVCLQEIKASEAQFREVTQPPSALPPPPRLMGELSIGSHPYVYINPAEKAGYSGTAILSKYEPISVSCELPGLSLANEGRVIVLELPKFYVVNCYVPHGGTRLEIKLEYMEQLLAGLRQLEKGGKPVVLCSDMNVAHTELDLSHPKACSKITGYLPEERAVMDRFMELGFIDSYRALNPDKQAYTWDSYRSKAGQGYGYTSWNYRFDYILASETLRKSIKSADILYDRFYSDHYPVMLEIEV
ncbi:MAG: exodeoxyribonuclease III [Firmicutes bacterium]|nr:exodeoxyribonuclease III [Bacillota bacterium]